MDLLESYEESSAECCDRAIQRMNRRSTQTRNDCPRENPRLCRGGCKSLTFPGVSSSRLGHHSAHRSRQCSGTLLRHGRLRKGPFEGPATVKPPALPEDISGVAIDSPINAPLRRPPIRFAHSVSVLGQHPFAEQAAVQALCQRPLSLARIEYRSARSDTRRCPFLDYL